MATKNIKIKRNDNGTIDTIHPETSWSQITDKPDTFAPTSHTHDVSEITGASLDPRLDLNLSSDVNRWWKIAAVNLGSGGLSLRGAINNHVESFGTQQMDLTIFGREGNSSTEISVDGTFNVAYSGVGVRIIKVDSGSPYAKYDVYIKTVSYTQCKIDVIPYGSTTLYNIGTDNTTTQPTGLAVEFDNTLTGEGSYTVVASSIYTNWHSGNAADADDKVSKSGDTMTGDLSLEGNLLLTGTATTTNQGRMIDFTGFDKEGTTDFSDRAYIQHTTNTGGHSGSVLVISSQNDAADGIAFSTHTSSKLKHNGNNIATETWVTSQGYITSADGGNATTLDSLDSGSFLRSDADDTFTGKLSVGSTNSRSAGIYGTYDSYRVGHIWSMGTGYAIPNDGSSFGNLYGLAYTYDSRVNTSDAMAGGHQVVWAANGSPRAAMGDNLWTSGNIITYGSNNRLGNGNGDATRINDTLYVEATDSGDSHIYFGEDSSSGYGAHLYWDSGYNFSWRTRNAGTDTVLWDYNSNDTSQWSIYRKTNINGFLQVNSNGQFKKNAHSSGANDSHLELYSDNVNSSGEVSLRMHQGNQWWGQIRLRSDGFHFTQGSDNSYRNVYAGTFYGALSGNASTATWADTVDVNTSSSSSYFSMLWASGDTVYNTNNKLTFQPSTGETIFSGNIIGNGHIYGRAVNGQYSNLYRFGGIYFTWDSDSYGTNFDHSLTSSYGGSYGDHLTLNSYGHIRMNIDSNNNGTNYFEVGGHTTGTDNTYFRITDTGVSSFYGNLSTTGNLTVGGTITANGLTLSNDDIVGVNSLSINDPGEGILWQGTTNVNQIIIDDANDNIMDFQNLAKMRIGGNPVPWIKTQGSTYQQGLNFTIQNSTLYISTSLT